jgi:hypothetical protein
MGLEVQRVCIGEQMRQAFCNGLAILLADADVDLHEFSFPCGDERMT